MTDHCDNCGKLRKVTVAFDIFQIPSVLCRACKQDQDREDREMLAAEKQRCMKEQHYFQDGGDFYNSDDNQHHGEFAHMVKGDYDMKGAIGARETFIAAMLEKGVIAVFD